MLTNYEKRAYIEENGKLKKIKGELLLENIPCRGIQLQTSTIKYLFYRGILDGEKIILEQKVQKLDNDLYIIIESFVTKIP